MKIEAISESGLKDALDFIAPFESECVNLACELLRGAKNCYVVRRESEECDVQGALRNTICGVFCFRNRRTLFHCLPFTKYKTLLDKALCQETQMPFYEFFADEKPFCVNGEASGSLFLKNILKNKRNPAQARCVNEYFLMRKDAMSETLLHRNAPSESDENMPRVLLADRCDEERLFPLERAYQLEEVVPADFNVSEERMREAFRAARPA